MSTRRRLLQILEDALGSPAPEAQGILVACSGGADSMALLHLLDTLRRERRPDLRLVVGHFDHALRGEESDGDRRFVTSEAARLGLACRTERWDRDATPAGSQEARAREARYDFLVRAARRQACALIATAHTREDAAETFLLRLLRGAGRTGLCGLRARRPLAEDLTLLRPLMEAGRAELRSFLEESGSGWRLDSSNDEQRFDRNRLRARIVPVLTEFAAGAMDRLARTSQILTEEERFLEEQAEKLANSLISERSRGEAVLQRAGYLGADPCLRPRLLRHLLRAARGDLQGIGARHLDGLSASLERGAGHTDLPGGWSGRSDGRGLRLAAPGSGEADPAGFCYECAIPGRVEVPTGYLLEATQLAQIPGPDDIRGESPEVALLDADRAGARLVVRSRRPGDRIRPLGMAGRSRKIQDLLVDRKVPREIRDRLPVIEADGEVAWIGGVAVAEPFRVRSSTGRVLRLELRPTGGGVRTSEG